MLSQAIENDCNEKEVGMHKQLLQKKIQKIKMVEKPTTMNKKLKKKRVHGTRQEIETHIINNIIYILTFEHFCQIKWECMKFVQEVERDW